VNVRGQSRTRRRKWRSWAYGRLAFANANVKEQVSWSSRTRRGGREREEEMWEQEQLAFANATLVARTRIRICFWPSQVRDRGRNAKKGYLGRIKSPKNGGLSS